MVAKDRERERLPVSKRVGEIFDIEVFNLRR
jgi:hypothetical protein